MSRLSSIINDCSNIIGNHQECFRSPAEALNRALSDLLAGPFAVNLTFICFRSFYRSFFLQRTISNKH